MNIRTILLSCLLYIGQSLLAQSPGEFNPDRLNRLRPLPPFDKDAGYRTTDSLISHNMNHSLSPSWVGLASDILLGPDIQLSKHFTLIPDGLLYIVNNYNPTDGVWIGYEFVGNYHLRPGHRLLFRISNNYTTHSHQWMSENHLLYYYAPKLSGIAVISGGITSRTTVHETYEELFTSEWLGQPGSNNPLDIYRKTFFTIRNSINVCSGLRTTALLQYEHRHPQPSPRQGYEHQALVGEIRLVWNPSERTIPGNRYPGSGNHPIGLNIPAPGITYRTTIQPSNSARIPSSSYQMLELNLRQSFALSPDFRVSWGAVAGTSLDRNRMSLADERYLISDLSVGRLPLSGTWSTISDSFYLGKQWVWEYTDIYIGRPLWHRILNVDLDESLHIRAVGSETGNWYEAGYSVGMGEMARIGLFAGGNFRDRFQLRVRLSLPLLLLLGKASSRY